MHPGHSKPMLSHSPAVADSASASLPAGAFFSVAGCPDRPHSDRASRLLGPRTGAIKRVVRRAPGDQSTNWASHVNCRCPGTSSASTAQTRVSPACRSTLTSGSDR